MDNFVRYLTERKHQVRTVRFRRHDTPGRIWYQGRHYVDDVRDAVSEFADPPVLIGHSFDGLVIQKYLERNPAPAAVLMASIPPRGTVGAVLRLALRHPVPFLKANLSLRHRPLKTVSRSRVISDLAARLSPDEATSQKISPLLLSEGFKRKSAFGSALNLASNSLDTPAHRAPPSGTLTLRSANLCRKILG